LSRYAANIAAALSGGIVVAPSALIGIAHHALPDAPIRLANTQLWLPALLGAGLAAFLCRSFQHAFSWLTSLLIGASLSLICVFLGQL
jgi:hypothetical protein